MLYLAVDRNVVAREFPRIDRLQSLETARPGTAIGVGFAGDDRKRLLAPLDAIGQLRDIVKPPREVGVEIAFLLLERADVEAHLGRQAVAGEAEIRVDGVVQEEVQLVRAEADAEVERGADAEEARDAGHETEVVVVAVEERRESLRQSGLDAECLNGRVGLVGVRCGVVARTIEKAITARRRRDVAVQVGIGAVADRPAGVHEKACVGGLRASPGLHERRVVERRVGAHAPDTGVDQCLRVGTLVTARQALVVHELEAQVREPVGAEPEAGVGGDLRALLAFVELAVVDTHLAAAGRVLHLQVDDAGNRVGAVLRHRAIAQNLHAFHGNAWNHADVRAVRAFAGGRHELGDEGGAMAALAVDHQQRLVGRQAAQRRRSNEGIAVSGRRRRVVRRRQCAQAVG